MNTSVISQINRTKDCMDDLPFKDTQSLINQLSSTNGINRMQAREALTCIGNPALLELLKTLSTADLQLRWEIIKVLEGISDPTTIPILVEQLKYEHAGVRWAAANALIGMGRDSIPSLLEALIHDFDSIWLRQSAHHILHVLKDDGKLYDAEEKVFDALEGVEPSASVPWAAQRALESLRHKKDSPASINRGLSSPFTTSS
jgi:HEAT repeat protein